MAVSLPALSQNEGRWYQVEILIFKRNNQEINPYDREFWRQDISLAYPEKTQYLPKILPNSVHELGGHNYTLRRDEKFDILFHKAWNQQMWSKKEAPALIIRGGESYGKYRELEGTITIHIGRYLHVSSDLWLSQFTINGTDQSRSLLPTLPGQSELGERFFVEEPQASQVITFREKRRMRSKETHYIDHPYMGMIIRMLPLDN